MNLDDLTTGQRQIVTTLDAPLMVSAGAGSGKTFTLTQRIAWALSPESGAGKPILGGIDEVLAITFTKKAAAELKSRVKRQLAGMGLDAEALRVDDAWISTIHGMCVRILREHALELGIDPEFRVIDEVEAGAFREEAYDAVIEELRETAFAAEGASDMGGGFLRPGGPYRADVDEVDDAALLAYVEQVGVHSASPNSSSAQDYVQALSARAEALPAGFDAVVPQLPTCAPAELLRKMVALGQDFLAVSGTLAKPTKSDAGYREAAASALEGAQACLQEGGLESFTAPDFDGIRFAKVFFAFPKTKSNYRTKKDDPGFFADYRASYAELAAEVEAGLASREIACVVELARRVKERFQRIKGPARLDNTDLLRLTHRALTRNPAIAEAYRSRFKMIMIDEFQDTDELQVALIRALAADGLSNVCTVGDAQQSIYRFRGADVNVFFGYRDALGQEAPSAQFVSLPDNFRSHADILSFVDAVFSPDEAFGADFLSLAPEGLVNGQHDALFEDRPRIELALFDCRRGGPGVAYGRTCAARAIARHFAELREGGVKASEMVLLMCRMTNVGEYAKALRKEGFECLVAGGSTFAKAPEVLMVQAAAAFLANQADDEALYQLLSSPLFEVGNAALVHLATASDPAGRKRRRQLAQGFAAWERECGLTGLSEEQSDRIDFAVLCVNAALKVLRQEGMAVALRELFRASGWFLRMEHAGVDGQAAVGNVHKALRMIAEIEQEGLGRVRTVQRFADACAVLKLSPGTLSTASSEFVRIMTVHASKGLEFPHVALADMRLGASSSDLCAENIDGVTYVSLKSQAASAVQSIAKDLRAFAENPPAGNADEVANATTAGERMMALSAYAQDQETADVRRLMYVALTRASKSLFMGLAFGGNKDFSYEKTPVLEDFHRALKWEKSADAPEQACPYGGSAPAQVHLAVLEEPAEAEDAELAGEKAPFLIPPAPPAAAPVAQPFSARDPRVFSYSSVAHDVPVTDVAEDAQPEEAFTEGTSHNNVFLSEEPDVAGADAAATALGIAFHRLAQRAICQFDGNALVCPPGDVVRAQVRIQCLSEAQALRLETALGRWFGSTLCHEFAAVGKPEAEVPFMVCLPSDIGPLYLEGEIDGLAVDGENVAHLVDYKTGGSVSETSGEIYVKHLLQAQCYACALLMQGYQRVEAAFVRVEIEDPHCPGEPQIQRYTFEEADLPALQRGIVRAYLAARQ